MAVDEVGKVTRPVTGGEPSTQPAVAASVEAEPPAGQYESGVTRAMMQKVVGQGFDNPTVDLHSPGTSAVPIAAPPVLVTVNPDGSAHLPVGAVVVGYAAAGETRVVTNDAQGWSELVNLAAQGVSNSATPALSVTDTDVTLVVKSGPDNNDLGISARHVAGGSQVLPGNFNTDAVTGASDTLYMQYGGDVLHYDDTTVVAWTRHNRGVDDEGNLFVSFNDGSGWRVTGPVSAPGGGFARHPHLLVTPGEPRRLFVAWNEGDWQEKCWLSEWNAATEQWQPLLTDAAGVPRPLENNPAFTTMYPVMAYDEASNALYVAYREEDARVRQPPYYTYMHVAKIGLGGGAPTVEQLGGPQGLGTLTDRVWPGEPETKRPENFNRPQISIVGGQVYVAFTEGPRCSHGGGEVLFVKRYDPAAGVWHQVGPELAVSATDVVGFGGGQYSAPVSFVGGTPVVPVMVNGAQGRELQLRAMVANAWRPVDLGAVSTTPSRYFHPVIGARSSNTPSAPSGFRIATFE